ncbi:MAG: DMT family transporter, partial [Alistipes sp.]|nr:DMT family transporter [Alistipes sp.]
MNKLKPHLALLACNCIWALDFPFYNLLLRGYLRPMALVAASLIATALISFLPLLWERAEHVERADIRKFVGAALLMGVFRKIFLMYGLSKTSPVDGSIIDTIVPILVLLLSVLLGLDRFTKLKVGGLLLGMAGAVAVVLTGASSSHAHSQLWGNVLILLCACVSSVYMVCFKKLVAKYRVTTVMRWLYCTAAIIVLPFSLGDLIHTNYAAMLRHARWPALAVF